MLFNLDRSLSLERNTVNKREKEKHDCLSKSASQRLDGNAGQRIHPHKIRRRHYRVGTCTRHWDKIKEQVANLPVRHPPILINEIHLSEDGLAGGRTC